jgi:hypothetical protein
MISFKALIFYLSSALSRSVLGTDCDRAIVSQEARPKRGM